jgi:hypothetical protein
MAAPAVVTARANSSVRDDGIFATRLMAMTERSAAIEEKERGNTAVGSFISKGLIGHSDLPEDIGYSVGSRQCGSERRLGYAEKTTEAREEPSLYVTTDLRYRISL